MVLKIGAIKEIPSIEVLLYLFWNYLKLCNAYQDTVKPISVSGQLGLHGREMKSDLQRIYHRPEVLERASGHELPDKVGEHDRLSRLFNVVALSQ